MNKVLMKEKLERELTNLFTDDTVLNIERVEGKIALVVNHPKIADYIMRVLERYSKGYYDN